MAEATEGMNLAVDAAIMFGTAVRDASPDTAVAAIRHVYEDSLRDAFAAAARAAGNHAADLGVTPQSPEFEVVKTASTRACVTLAGALEGYLLGAAAMAGAFLADLAAVTDRDLSEVAARVVRRMTDDGHEST